MSNGLEASQVRAVFFPERKRFTFHRINMEYLVSLKEMNRDSIFTLLNTGLQGNLHRIGGNDDVLRSLRPQLEKQAHQVSQQSLYLQKERAWLRSQLAKKSKEGFSVYRAEVGADFANRQLTESLALHAAQAHERVLSAEHILKETLAVNHRNYHAHFELGWAYMFLLERQEQAEFHLSCAARIAKEEGNRRFAVFALRHLGDVCYSLGKYEEAISVALEVIRQAPLPDMEHLYECARYMAAAGKVDIATRRLAALVAQSSVYYVQAQAEPDFIQHDEVREMLYDLRQIRVKRIRHYVSTSWHRHQLSRLPLPDSIDPHKLFQQTFRKHINVMAHLPYGVLSQREQQIGDLIVHDSQKRIMQEIQKRSQQYESVSELKRQRWSWINKTGGFLIHGAAVLLLACVMFFVARHFASWFGMSAWLSADSIINYLLSLMLGMLVTGAALIQFVPLGSKKRLRKQIELDNTLKLLEAS